MRFLKITIWFIFHALLFGGLVVVVVANISLNDCDSVWIASDKVIYSHRKSFCKFSRVLRSRPLSNTTNTRNGEVVFVCRRGDKRDCKALPEVLLAARPPQREYRPIVSINHFSDRQHWTRCAPTQTYKMPRERDLDLNNRIIVVYVADWMASRGAAVRIHVVTSRLQFQSMTQFRSEWMGGWLGSPQ